MNVLCYVRDSTQFHIVISSSKIETNRPQWNCIRTDTRIPTEITVFAFIWRCVCALVHFGWKWLMVAKRMPCRDRCGGHALCQRKILHQSDTMQIQLHKACCSSNDNDNCKQHTLNDVVAVCRHPNTHTHTLIRFCYLDYKCSNK